MLAVVVIGTLCGIYAPSLQSKAIDIIAGSDGGILSFTLILMLSVYLIYSASQFLQGLLSAHQSENCQENAGGAVRKDDGSSDPLPGHHSHGDVIEPYDQ